MKTLHHKPHRQAHVEGGVEKTRPDTLLVGTVAERADGLAYLLVEVLNRGGVVRRVSQVAIIQPGEEMCQALVIVVNCNLIIKKNNTITTGNNTITSTRNNNNDTDNCNNDNDNTDVNRNNKNKLIMK